MKRFFKSLMVASCVVALAATGALAAGQITVTGDDNVTNPIVKTDFRLLKDAAYKVGPGNPDSKYNSKVTYAPGITLALGSTIGFELTNGSFPSDTYYLVKESAIVGMLTLNADGNKLTFTTVAAIDSADVLLLSKTDPTGLSGITMFDVLLDKGLAANTDVTIAVTEATENGVPVDALAAAKTLYGVADGVKVTLSGNAANVIDVYADRKSFVAGSGDGDPANKSIVGVKVTTNENGVLNQVDFSEAPWNLTISGNLSGVMSVQVGDKDAYVVQEADRQAQSVVLSSAANSGVNWKSGVNVAMSVFDDNQTGAGAPLDVRTFTYKFDDNSTAIVDGEKLVDWKLNGGQFMVPIMNAEYDGKGRPVKPTQAGVNLYITNTSGQDAAITADFIGEDVFKQKVVAFSVPIGTVNAGSAIGLNALKIHQQIMAAYPSFTGVRFSGLFTFTAPQDKIFVDAWQAVGATGKRGVQVLTPANNVNPDSGLGSGAWK